MIINTKKVGGGGKETVTWHQCPEAVKNFLSEIAYTGYKTIVWTPTFTETRGTITWATSDSTIATAASNDSNSGLITAVERAEDATNLTATITATRGSESKTLSVRVDRNATYTNNNTVISCVMGSYAPTTVDNSNAKPIGKTVDGLTFYNEVPNVETPFSATNVAGTVKPLDALRWFNTTIASGTYYALGKNTRDLGGWACDGGTIKYGVLIRGGEINPADKELMVNKIGIKTEVSLLPTSARQYTESPWGIDYVENPTDVDFAYQISGANIVPQWRLYLDTIFKSVSHSKPVYFHCGYGADKTGTVSCILLAILGVSESDIQKEFELTSFGIGEQARRKMLPKLLDRLKSVTLHSGLTDNLRNRVISWVLSLSDSDYSFTIDKINSFRSNCISGTPTPITITQSVTNNLTHCSNGNATASVAYGATYIGLISADSGYSMSSISVTMGGVDITSTSVSGNSISIASVTGDIVITATAINTSSYSITNNLSNCTNSNSAVSVVHGSSYTGTISANSGYNMSSISVTMGGNDITASAVSGNNISIASVTGAIVITASAISQGFVFSMNRTVATNIPSNSTPFIDSSRSSEWNENIVLHTYTWAAGTIVNNSSTNASTLTDITANSVTSTSGSGGGCGATYPIHVTGGKTYTLTYTYSGAGATRVGYAYNVDGTTVVNTRIQDGSNGDTGTKTATITIPSGSNAWLFLTFGANTGKAKSYTNVSLTENS